jgi:NAD(P)-dependent dehydrogenase (short-subunit alcohol dehydrogenase family)
VAYTTSISGRQRALIEFLRMSAIVSISSIAAIQVGAGLAAYSASKAGLTLLTQTIAFENARHGVRANVCQTAGPARLFKVRLRTELGSSATLQRRSTSS